MEVRSINSRGEDEPTKSGAKDNLYCPPRLSGKNVEVAGECNSRKNVGKKDIDSTCYNKLVEHLPVGDISPAQVPKIFLQEPERLQLPSSPKFGGKGLKPLLG